MTPEEAKEEVKKNTPIAITGSPTDWEEFWKKIEIYHLAKVNSELGDDLIHNLRKAKYPEQYIDGVLNAKRILNQ